MWTPFPLMPESNISLLDRAVFPTAIGALVKDNVENQIHKQITKANTVLLSFHGNLCVTCIYICITVPYLFPRSFTAHGEPFLKPPGPEGVSSPVTMTPGSIRSTIRTSDVSEFTNRLFYISSV